jgi:pilus assembly protein CpaB
MNKKALVVLILALVMGAFTAFWVNRMMKSQAKSSSSQMRKVVIAVATVPIGSQIRADQVRVEEWPKAPDGTFDDVSKVVDRVTMSEIVISEPILSSRLAAVGSAAGVVSIIPQGMRAMAVKVDEVIGVAGFIFPGTYVDVVATVLQGMEGESASRVILQNVKVLASGKSVEKKSEGESVDVNTVTLQVTPDQSELLALASNAGKLQLILRNSTDQEQIETPGADTQAVFGSAMAVRRAPATQVAPPPTGAVPPTTTAAQKPGTTATPPPPPKPQFSVEMIQGSQRNNVTFEKQGSQ